MAQENKLEEMKKMFVVLLSMLFGFGTLLLVLVLFGQLEFDFVLGLGVLVVELVVVMVIFFSLLLICAGFWVVVFTFLFFRGDKK